MSFLFTEKENVKKVGTKQMKRLHDIVHPEELLNCTPTLAPTVSYLYVINYDPKFDQTVVNSSGILDRNRRVFHELLSNDSTYGILTTKQLPKLPAMRFFMSFGETQVKISHNPFPVLMKSEEQLKQLRKFHVMIFKDLLKTIKNCLVPVESGANSYMIVPVKGNEINWNVVQNFQSLPEPKILSEPERRRMKFEREDYLYKVSVFQSFF